MSLTRHAHDLLVISGRAALVLVKSLLIVLTLHLVASYFHWHLFREAGGSVGLMESSGGGAAGNRRGA